MEIQAVLLGLGLLEPQIGDRFCKTLIASLKRFADLINSPETDYLGGITAKRLLDAQNPDIRDSIIRSREQLKLSEDLASHLVRYMLSKDYFVSTNPREVNIIYVEGMSLDGKSIRRDPHKFSDLRMAIGFVDNCPKVLGKWAATLEPGNYFSLKRDGRNFCQKIMPGQYKAWQLGVHGNYQPHEALVQVSELPVSKIEKVEDEFSSSFYSGFWGINQHCGYDFTVNNILNAVQGNISCLVGQTRQGHIEFMELVKSDPRYLSDDKYVFLTTVIKGDWSCDLMLS